MYDLKALAELAWKNSQRICAMYVWPDGQSPTQRLRCKTKILDEEVAKLDEIPKWGFDGSSTFQAPGEKSDCVLLPVRHIIDPLLGSPNIIVLCEVMLPNGDPHPSNTRSILGQRAKQYAALEPLLGIEQEYTLYDRQGIWPYQWPANGFPSGQGRYYCGSGSDEANGRNIVTIHTLVCMAAGIRISGTNGEVMPSQWEYQIGPLDPLAVCDQILLSRWLLYRIGEDMDVSVKLRPKPVEEGQWNGAGAHLNVSTKAMREPGGFALIEAACRRLGEFHRQHIQRHVYGDCNEKRLTGQHETAPITKFWYGVGDRTASVRIPAPVAMEGCGYLEDRRPAANIDPYRAVTAILETVCGDGFDPDMFSYFKENAGDSHLR
ncbi:MAG: glutamine synthetase beta-grasp domain-containing protein [Candidatus Komeilibacteria bacterium]|nr:glutamine synthetase beta-grasp domain-containing protein [Candidatus Komeilibacteria bacterium]